MYLRPNSNVCVNFLFIVFLILSTLSVLCGLFCIWFSLSSPSQCPHLVIRCLGFCRIDPGDQLSLSNHSPRLHKIITSAALCECVCVLGVGVCVWWWSEKERKDRCHVHVFMRNQLNSKWEDRKSLTSCIVAVMWPDVDSRHHAQRTTILTILSHAQTNYASNKSYKMHMWITVSNFTFNCKSNRCTVQWHERTSCMVQMKRARKEEEFLKKYKNTRSGGVEVEVTLTTELHVH